MHSLFENHENFGKNPFVSFTPHEASEIVNKLNSVPKDTTLSILTTKRPNIVLFIMESWSHDLIEDLGGMPGITPEFKKLEKDGILFTNFWPNGTRSEQGIACIFSSFPAHPISSITVQPDKYTKLPSLVKILKDQGYFTSYYFGGQLIYGNMKGYVYFNEFNRITEGYDLPENMPRGKLGVPDQYVFDYQMNEISQDKRPFFCTTFTLSTHSPYDMPMHIKNFVDNRLENLYINSGYYTDSCLGDYFRKAREKDWYDSTLFIVVADHSRDTYKHWDYHTPDYHKTFLFLYGNVIKPEYRGTKVEHMGSQVDIAATLLAQLDLDSKGFQWSKNLFNPYSQQFASVAFEEGIGWIRPYGYFFYDKKLDHFYCLQLPDSLKQQTINEGKAYLQEVFQEYTDY